MSEHLPVPASQTLLDQLRQSLGSGDTFHWRQRLLTERLIRNVTALHERILLYVRELIDGGLVQFSHSEVAEACHVGVGTVKDALRRAQGIGLLDWRAEYRPGPCGVRRRTANTYQALMPQRSPQPRPDLRRHPKPKPAPLVSKDSFSFLPSCAPQCDEPNGRPLPGFEARFAAKLAEEKWLRAARLARKPP